MSVRTTQTEKTMNTKNKLAFMLAAGTLLFGVLAQAQPPSGSGQDRRGPPPEAIEACSGASEGQACTVDTPHGTLEGTCRQVPNLDELACVPNDHRGGPPRGER
jgi:hypothetical protein